MGLAPCSSVFMLENWENINSLLVNCSEKWAVCSGRHGKGQVTWRVVDQLARWVHSNKAILICKLVHYETKTTWVTHDVRPYPSRWVSAQDLTTAAANWSSWCTAILEYGTRSNTTSWRTSSSSAFTIFKKVKWEKKAQKKENRITWILEIKEFKQPNFI